MKKLILSSLMLFFSLSMMAIGKVEVDGIYYEIFDSGLTLVVKYNDVGDEIVYSGDIYLPDEITVDGVTYSVEGIESEVFMNCTELTSIRLPENLYEITRGVFSGCTGLTSIVIPNGVNRIESDAFKDCTSLNSVKVEWDTPLAVPSSTFTEVRTNTATLFVPIGTKGKYATADVWKAFTKTQEYEVSGIGEIVNSQASNRKYLENGRVVIIHNGNKFSTKGTRMK